MKPKTVKEAVNTVISWISKDELDYIKSMKKEDLYQLHHGLGRKIRNEFGIWNGNDTLQQDIKKVCINLNHPDDYSSYILQRVWDKLNEKQQETINSNTIKGTIREIIKTHKEIVSDIKGAIKGVKDKGMVKAGKGTIKASEKLIKKLNKLLEKE